MGPTYIDLAKAAALTGKSIKTLRRLAAKDESKPHISRDEAGKIYIDVNYLTTAFEPVQGWTNETGQAGQTEETQPDPLLVHKIEALEQQLAHAQELLQEKNERIIDLQRAMLLLQPPQTELPAAGSVIQDTPDTSGTRKGFWQKIFSGSKK